MMYVDTLMLLIKIKGAKMVDAALKKTEQRLGRLSAAVKKAMKNIHHFEMTLLSIAMSTFFFGMALQHLARQMMTSVITAFVKARGEGDFLVNKLLSIQAAFEFLKFAIFDAFANTEFFIKIVDFIVRATNAVSLFIAKRPGLATMIVGFAGVAFVVGTLFMLVGFLTQGLMATISVTKVLIGAFKLFGKVGLLSWAKALVPITAAIGLVAYFITVWDNLKKGFNLVMDVMKLRWNEFVRQITFVKDYMVAIFDVAWNALKLGAVHAFNAIIESWEDAINKVIRAYNRLASVVPWFSTVGEITLPRVNTTEYKKGLDEAVSALDILGKTAATERAMFETEQKALFNAITANTVNSAQKWNETLSFLPGFGGGGMEDAAQANTSGTNTENNVVNNVNIEMGPIPGEADVQTLADQIKQILDEETNRTMGAPRRG